MLPTVVLFQWIAFIICLIFIFPLIIYVNTKLYYNIKKEEHLDKGRVIQYIIRHYAELQYIGWPCVILAFGLTKLLNSISLISENLPLKVVVSTLRYLNVFFRDYLQFHSLIVAICRYTFIILESKAERFGISRLRRLFIGSSIAVPLLTSTLYELTCPIEKSYISWFYGISLNQGIANSTGKNEEPAHDEDFESVAFTLFNSYFSSFVIDSVGLIETALFSIIYSNVIEGLLYTHIFIVYYR